jgi:hypothetical protein
MVDVMFGDEPGGPSASRDQVATGADRVRSDRATPQAYGTIVVVGGGCYGSYYVRQLGRASDAGALTWRRLVVVDRDPDCRVAREPAAGATIVTREWVEFFAEFLDAAAGSPDDAAADAIVPSPLMPHLLFDWIVARTRSRWPDREVSVRAVDEPPAVPWQRSSPDGNTHYVSFAEWMCPINCIEPVRCPATRGPRSWSMPSAIAGYVGALRARGHNLAGPFVFHCTHRAYGVGMIDVRSVIDADAAIGEMAVHGPADVLIGTMSHCHGALGRLAIG